MAQLNDGRVDILSRDDGSLLSQANAGSSRTVLLNQPSVVKVHGTREMVAEYERQGNDLILHMKDGTTVRYQQFFFDDVDGEHSELVFDDGVNPPEHALFPVTSEFADAQTAMAITPQYESLESIEPLLLADTGAGPGLVTAAGLGALGLVGLGAAALGGGGGGGGGGDDGDNGGPTTPPNPPANAPTLTIGTFAGDNVLSAAEKETTQLLSGTTTNVQAGQTVVIVLNGVTYNATVQANGSWSVAVPVSALAALENGSATISATVSNTAGQSANDTHNFTVEVSPAANVPQIAMGIFAGNDVLDGAEKLTSQTLSGTTVNVQQGQTVTVTLNGKTYTGTVDADGVWNVSVPATDLALLATGSATLSASVTNTGGTSASATHTFSVQESTTPSVSVTSPVSGDGYLSADEVQGTLILSGSASGVPVGTAVSVTLGGISYPAVTQTGGGWTVTVPSADLQQLPQGSNLIVASITLPNGTLIENSTTVSVDVITTAPVVQVDLPFVDGVLSGAEIGQPQTVTGTTGVTGPNQTVSIDFNGVNYPGTVNNDGSWSVTIPAGSVTNPTEGTLPLVVNVTDPAGNTGSSTLPVTVDNTPPVVTVAPFDSALNATDITQPLTLTGTSVGGQSVTVSLYGQTYTAPVNPDGSWSVNIPASALQQLDQGNNDLVVTSTDKYGNTSPETTLPLSVDTVAPTGVTLTPVTDNGDNYVSADELGTLTIKGTAESGSTIRVFIGEHELSLTGNANGNNEWSIVVSDADKAALADGSYPIRVEASDAAGNVTTAYGNVTLAVEPGSQPLIEVNTFAGDNVLQNAELGVDQELSGRVLNVEQGQPLIVTFNGEQYPTTVLAGGLWHVTIPADALAGLTNGELVNYGVSVSNAAGVTALFGGNYPVINDPLAVTLAIAPVGGDNWINATEARSPVTVSGSSQGVPQGTLLTVTFNDKSYSATVGADGSWTTQIPAADFVGVANNNYEVKVEVATDPGTSATLNVGVQANFPDNVTVNAAFGGDNILNLTESTTPQTITGNTGLTLPDQTVTVEINGTTYNATVNPATGAWSVNLLPADLALLPQGSNDVIVTVRDAAGNEVTHTTSVSVDTLAPDLNVGTVAEDGVINRTEQGQPLPLSGTAEPLSIITVVLNGVTYRTAADTDGNWSVNIAPSTLQTLADGQYDISVTARDSGGNETTTLTPITIDTASPPVTVAPVSGDGYLNALEHNAALAITGTTEPGAGVVVRVNGVDYNATVDANGNWTATLPANVVSGLADNTYTVTATATDPLGNSGSSSQPLTVIAASGSLPSVTVGAFAGDNILDGAEKGLSQFVTGTTTNVQAGQTVTVSLNGANYTGQVLSDGSWSVLVPASALHNLANGTDSYTVSVSDVAGNPATTNGSFTVDNTFSAIAIGVISDDNTLNASEALLPLSIHGFSRFVASGSSVSVSFRGKSYLTTTNSDGSWTVTVPPADLANLTNTTLLVTASTVDINGNTITVEHSLNSEVLPGFLPEINPLFGDDYLNAQEAGSAQTISGTSGVEGAGQTVNVLIGGITYTGTVDALGNWSVSVPSAALQNLPQGPNTASVTLGDGAGNSVKVDTGFTVDTVAPVVTLDPVAADNRINLEEQNDIQTLSGSGTQGDRIRVTLNNQTYDVVVDGTGHWEIDLPVNALKALTAGSYELQVTSTDEAGNVSTVVRTIEVDITPPPVTVNAVSGGYINAAESIQPLTVTGTGEAGNVIRVELAGTTVTTVVGADGSWSALIPGNVVAGVTDGDYTLSVTAVDPAGNTTLTSTPLVVDTGVPSIVVNNVTPNNSIDGAEQQVDQIITGTASNVEAGQTLTLTLNGNGATYTTTALIQSGGGWQANLPAEVLEGLANGSYTLTASVTDKAGNSGTTDKTFSVDDTQPAIAVSPISEDGYLNFNESQAPGGLDIILTTLNVPADSRVTFNFNNTTYDAVLQPNGTWLVNIPRADVGVLTNGTVTGVATVYDSSENPLATSNAALVVHVTNLPNPTLDTPFGDNTLTNAEAIVGQTLTGTTGELGDGQRVLITIGNSAFEATVNSSGVWSLVLTTQQLLDLDPKGASSILVTAIDVAGNSAEAGPTGVTIATDLPALTLGTIAEDGIINATEQQAPLVIEGTTAAGNAVVITLEGKTYNAVFGNNGSWTVTIPPADLALLEDGGYDVTVTVTDPVGNKTVDTGVVIVDTAAPTYTLDPIGGDGIIDRVEVTQPLDITGSGTFGDSVSVTLGGITLDTTVDNDGKWSVTFPVTTLNNLGQGQNPVTVVVTNPEGNSVTQNTSVILDTAVSNALLVNPIAGDDIVNTLEAAAGLTVTGSVPDGTTSVVVTFNNQSYNAIVGPDGLWSATIPSTALTGLADNGYTVTVVATPQGGDSVTVTHPIVLDTTPPDFVITQVSDGYLNGTELAQPLAITGTGTPGDSVRVTLNGKVYLTTVGNDNSWAVSVPTGDLAGLNSGTNTVSVVVKDPAGNTTTQTSDFTVDTLAPSLALDPVTGDNIINASEQQNGIAISGTGENGAAIVVTLNGKTYETTVGVNGLWSVAVSSTDLGALTGSSYPVSVTETDLAGNKTTQTSTVQINTSQPTITVDPFTGNGIVDGAEQHVSQQLTGTTTNVEEGQLVTLALNGVTYSGVVQASGAWSITLPAAALEALSNGQQTYVISVSNSANTAIDQSGSFEVNNLLSGLAINPISGDGFLNAQEATQPLEISGTSANFTVGAPLTVTVGGTDFPATVGANGQWTLTLQPGDIPLVDGPLTVTVSGSDAAGTAVTSSSSLDVHLTNLPNVVVDAPFGDSVLNAAEAGSTQTLTGSTGVPGDGQTVTLTLAGITYTGTVDGNGNWSVAIPGTVLAGLPQDTNTITVLVNDAAGNPSELTVPFTVDTLAPTVTVDAIAGDGVLNAAERGSDLAVTGTGENGSSIVVTLNGVTYPPVVVSGGSWTVTVPAEDLQAIPDGSYAVSVTATDAAQNSSAPVSSTLVVKADAADLPTITINTFAGNNIVDGAEQQSNQLLSGATTNVEPGQTVTVTLGSLVYNPVVQSDGSWSISIPSGTLQNGTPTITAAVSDAAGNPASSSLNITVNTQTSGISIDPISDGYLNASESQQSLIITGHTANVTTGTPVSVLINGQTFTVNVGAGGVWSALVPASALAGLADGQTLVSASTVDSNGNPVASNSTLNVVVHNLPQISVDTPFGDGVLNASEAALAQTLHGTTGVAGAGQTVSVLIGTTPYTGTVDANGNWSISLPSAVLQGLPQTGADLAVTVTDVAGNSSSQTVSVAVDTVAPTITVDPIATDGVINATEAAQGVTIRGGTTGAQEGQTVSVVFNGQTYTTTVDDQGNWNLSISADALTGVANGVYTLTATVTDAAGNSGPVSTNVTLAASTLQPTINTPFGDGYLNNSEATDPAGQSLSGTTGAIGAGQTVIVTVGTQEFTVTADINGNWTLPLTTTQLQTFDEGNLPISVEVTNAQGNTGSVSSSVIVDRVAPTLSLDPVAGDNVINGTEILQTVTISGTASPDEVGQQVSITFNGNQPAYIAIVQDDGSWRFDLPGSITQNLADESYTVTAMLTDKAGNTSLVATETVEVRAEAGDLPLITIDAITGDDYLNTSEVGQALQLSGTTTNVADGQMVEITFNGQTFYAEVNGGVWGYLIPATAVESIADGPQQVSVSVNDIYGNVGDDTRDFTVIARGEDLPSITINPVTSDDMVDYNESRNPNGVTITGSSQHIPEGDNIIVTVNNKPYTATVDADGNWTATIPQADAQQLPQNTNPITATGNDVAGNTATANESFTVHTQPPLLEIDANLATDGVLSLADALAGLLLEGTTGPNLNVEITLGTKVYSVLSDDLGHWSTTIPSADLLALVDGDLGLSVSVKDAYGNTTEQIIDVNVAVNALTELTLETPFVDGFLNSTEVLVDQTIRGTVDNLPDGASLVVNVGTQTYSPVVLDGLGGWSVTIPAADLAAMGNGVIQVSVSTVDAVNPVSVSADAELVLTTTLNPVINTPFVDGLLDVAEAAVSQTLTGSTGILGEGQTIVLTINGTAYPATVDANGVWTATLNSTQLLGLGNSTGNGHEIVIIVGDAAGNTATTSLDFPAIVTGLPTVTLDPLSLAGNGILTLNEVAGGITLGGNVTFNGDPANTHVIVNVNGTPIEAVINSNGTWSLPLSGDVLETLPDGTWPITVTVTDGVGNVGLPADASLTVAINDVPVPTITTPFLDGLLNIAEAGIDQVLRGSTGVLGAGQTVTVSIDGQPAVPAVVNANGSWSLGLSTGLLSGLTNGEHTITVVATDAYGNEAEVDGSFDALLTLPVPTIVNPFGDGLGIVEAAGTITITGNTGIPVVPGQDQSVTLKVDVNGVVYDATVAGNVWTVELPPGALNGLSNTTHQVIVTVIDAAGNPATETLDFNAYLTVPQPTLEVPFDNGYLNVAELAGTVLSGTTGAVGAGQTVTVIINGNIPIPAIVDANGNWTATLTPGELADIVTTQGSHTLQVSVTDPGGNTNTLTEGFIIDTAAPVINGLTFAGDNVLNYVESLNTQTLTGVSNPADAGATVTLSIGTQTLTGQVGADGAWTINVGVTDLAALVVAGGNYTVSITDVAGNTTSVNGAVGLNLSPTLDGYITLAPVSGDNVINVADGPTTLISGTLNNVPLSLGGQITITVGGILVDTISVDALRLDNEFTSRTLVNADLPAGSQQVVVTFTPTVGDPVVTNTTVLIDITAPTVTITQFAGDNILTVAEAATSQTITGTSSEIGSTVSVTLGTKTYTAVVQAGGSWTVNVPSADLQGLAQDVTSISASVKDAAGNTGTAVLNNVVVDTVAPALLNVDALLGDNVINAAEALLTQTLTGTVSGADGQTISVYLGNSNVPLAQGTVLNGAFNLELTPTAIGALLQGGNVLTVRVADDHGNQTSAAITINKVFNSLLGLTVDTVFGDPAGTGGYLNAVEAGLSQLITGTAVSAAGGLVSLTLLSGQILTATVGQDGKWSLAVPPAALATLQEGANTLNLVVTDVAGNTATAATSVTTIVNNLPVVNTLTNLFGDNNVLNLLEAQAGQTIGGTLNAVAGSVVTVTLGAKAYTTTVQAGGGWSVNLSATDLLALGNGNVSLGVKVVDPAGNVASTSTNITVATIKPEIILNPILGDGLLNIADLSNVASQLVSGTVKNVAAGTIITVTIGTTQVEATVDASGKFSAGLTLGQLQGLQSGLLDISASVKDSLSGNESTLNVTGGLQVSLTPPALSLNQTQLFGDGLLNAADALVNQLISGTTSAGARVVVTVGNSTTPLLSGTAGTDGVFNLALTPSALATLLDGGVTLKVTVTDTAGNSSSSSLSGTVGIHALPSVTLNPLFGDGILSVTEALSSLGQVLSGHVNNVAAGTRVDIKVGGLTLQGQTDANGDFNVTLSSATLLGLATGGLTVSATVTDAVGNVGSSSVGVTIGVHVAPTVTVGTLFGDGILNAAELATAQTISGTSTNAVAGSTVSVTLNGTNYSTTVGSNGSWSISIPKTALALIPDGPLTITANLADPYGNTASGSNSASVIAHTTPTITFGTLFGDGALNAVEAQTAQTISGTAFNAEGSTILVNVGSKTYSTVVAANGSWSVSVPSVDLKALPDTTTSISASVINGAGTSSGTITLPVIVGTHTTPTVTLGNSAGFSDGYFNLAESGTAQVITGTSTNAAGGRVTVNIEGLSYTGTVASNGTWSVTIPAGGLTSLADGQHTAAITVADRAGNTTSTSASFNAVTHNLPAVSVDAVASLLSVLLTGLTISGGSLRLATGTAVTITLSQSGQTQTMTTTVGANGRYSAKFVGGLLSTLDLSSVVTVTAVDAAGNPATTVTTLLLGSVLPLATTASVMMAVASDDSLASTDTASVSAASTSEESTTTVHTDARVASTLVTDSDTSSTDSATTSTTASTTASSENVASGTTDDGSYTIGGVTITLADGQTLHGESVTGSVGNDTITVSTLDFTHIDGGAGTDTLVLNGEHMALDLTSLGLKIEHVEIIDLGTSGNNSIKLDLNEALNITDKQSDDLLIKGTLGDQVTLANTDGGVWATTGQRTVEGQTFDVYHNSALSSDNTLGDVLIQHNLQVHVV